LPTAQNLRSAYRWGKKIKIKIKSRSKTKRGGLTADLTLRACPPLNVIPVGGAATSSTPRWRAKNWELAALKDI
jgi:hypothetical protein